MISKWNSYSSLCHFKVPSLLRNAFLSSKRSIQSSSHTNHSYYIKFIHKNQSKLRILAYGMIPITGYCLWNHDFLKNLIPEVQASTFSNFPNLRHQFNFIADVVEKSADIVVCVEIVGTSRLDYFARSQPSSTNGSGFIVSEDGLILTNAHVVMAHPQARLNVRLANGTVYPGRVEAVDIKSDLATIRIKPKEKLPVAKFGISKDLRPGEWVIAMGSPLSLSNTITAGIVSSAHRSSTELGLMGKNMEYIQTDASITFGNSGGPLINLNGEVVGINSMKVSSGISFAIPIDYAKNFLEQRPVKKSKEVYVPSSQRYLGITMVTLNPEILGELKQMNHQIPDTIKEGAIIWKVVIGSPAHKGGLIPGDIVIEINGICVNSSDVIYNALETSSVLNIKILRGKQPLELVIYPEDV